MRQTTIIFSSNYYHVTRVEPISTAYKEHGEGTNHRHLRRPIISILRAPIIGLRFTGEAIRDELPGERIAIRTGGDGMGRDGTD